jgi:acyl carrier protein
VNSLDDFIAMVRDELSLLVTVDDAGRGLRELPEWDSLHLLTLVTVIEDRTGRNVSVIDLLEAPDLASIYELAKAG